MVAVADHEVRIGFGGDWYRFKVAGSAQPGLEDPFPEKIVIGDYSRADEGLASSWIQSDWSDGFGVEFMDPKAQMNRFWDSTLWTLQKNGLCLPPRAVNLGHGTALGPISAGTTFGGLLYVAWGRSLRQLSSSLAISAQIQDLGSGATDMEVYDSKLWVACSGDHLWSSPDGVTFTDEAAGGADFLCNFDGKLWRINDDGTNCAMKLGSAAWDTTHGSIPGMQAGDVRGLEVYFTPVGVQKLHAITKSGLWVYDDTNKQWLPTMFKHARHPDAGLGYSPYRDSLFVAEGMDVFRFTGDAVSNVGLGVDDGPPPDIRGRFRNLQATQNWLVGLVDASVTSALGSDMGYFGWTQIGSYVFPRSLGNSSVLLWNDRGWNHMWRSARAGAGSNWMFAGETSGEYRLFWDFDGDLHYMKLNPGIVSPRNSADMQAWGFADSGYLVTPWNGGGWDEIQKLILRQRLRSQGCSRDEVIRFYAGFDLKDAWNEIATITSDGRFDYGFGLGAGQEADYVRFKITMERGSDIHKTPTLVYAGTKFTKEADRHWGLALQLDLTDSYGGLSPSEQFAVLQHLAKQIPLKQVAWRDARGTDEVYWMRITGMHAVELAGPDGRGTWQLTFSEV